jgi:hypothetical protein
MVLVSKAGVKFRSMRRPRSGPYLATKAVALHAALSFEQFFAPFGISRNDGQNRSV